MICCKVTGDRWETAWGKDDGEHHLYSGEDARRGSRLPHQPATQAPLRWGIRKLAFLIPQRRDDARHHLSQRSPVTLHKSALFQVNCWHGYYYRETVFINL